MNNAQKFDQRKEDIKLFIEEKKIDGLIDSDIKKEIAKPENEGGFGVTLRTAQRWYLLLNKPTLGDYETIENKKEVIRKGIGLINDNLERLVLSENKEERQDIKNEIEISCIALKGANTIRSY